MTLITKKHPLGPYLALYMPLSQHALFTKAMSTNYMIRHDFNCYINEKEAPKTLLPITRLYITPYHTTNY